jgi:glutamine synthetase
MRGKRIPATHWNEVCENGTAHSMVMFAMDMTCDVWDTPYANFENGFPDMHVHPFTKPVALPWEPGVAMCMGQASDKNGKPVPIDPRQPLIEQIKRASAMGFEVKVGNELEFYLLDSETLLPRDTGIDVYGLDRAAELEHVLGPIRNHINACGIPIEQSNPEYAAGQVEVNIRFGKALEAADQVVLFRSMVKQLARQKGYHATFMAKPFAKESGNGFHTHYSLWKDGKNAFAEGETLNSLGCNFVAGLQSRMAEASVCGSATVNGYRRRKPLSFCPINTSWGVDNRTVGLRVIEGSETSVRIEKRDAGADCNPYYLLATDIAAGLDGIEQSLEPSPPTVGSGYYDEDAEPIPTDLQTALELARNSDWLKQVMGELRWEIHCQMCERELAIHHDFIDQRILRYETERYLKSF